MVNLCKTCVHNCTDNKKNVCPVKNGIWCNAEYGRPIKKKVVECKNYSGSNSANKFSNDCESCKDKHTGVCYMCINSGRY